MKVHTLITSGFLAASLFTASAPLTVLAQEDNIEERHESTSVDVACVKTAISKREDAIIVAVDAFNASLKAAHVARKAALLAAWDLTNVADRRTALKTARRTFKETAKQARKTLQTSRKAVWDTFKTDAKACGYNTGADDGSAREDMGSSI